MFRQQVPSSGRSDISQHESKIKTITYVVYK
jgi:hypothetical protein